ncbi:hypothetical protein ACFOU0_04480 [Salinicoccus sesuvii]|uniref:Uncharacterized protein n=1 Tax=Salinicoccus sesuvii TaxID=868281 RepID=A0ABV7N2P9_9STAP
MKCEKKKMTYNIEQARIDMNSISSDSSLSDKMLEVSAIITRLMSEEVNEGDLPIIVGGLSLEIFTESKYTTHDIDFLTSASGKTKEILSEIGFVHEEQIFI